MKSSGYGGLLRDHARPVRYLSEAKRLLPGKRMAKREI